MARQPYTEDQSIHSMTTRQLRQYISDKAEEAQKRLDSAVGEDTTKAFREAAWEILGSNGKVKRSTSNMSKAEMREYAYSLRQFNSLDTTSGFAQSVEWRENKSKYETFVKNRIDEGSAFWKQFKTEKGNISKRGYKAYKDYISFIQGISEYKSHFGYRTLTQYAESAEKGEELIDKKSVSDEDLKKLGLTREEFDKLNINIKDLTTLNKILAETFEQAQGKGLDQAKLIDKFELALIEEANRNKPKKQSGNKRSGKKQTVKTYKGKKSKSDVKIKKGRQMKGGKVRERLTN